MGSMMKLCVVVVMACVLFMSTLTMAASTKKTENKDTGKPYMSTKGVTRDNCAGSLDNLNEDNVIEIMDEPAVYDFYRECILEDNVTKAQCNCQGWEFRRIMNGLVVPSLCRRDIQLPYCPTPEQRKLGQDLMKHLSKVDNTTWKKVLRKYGGKGSTRK
ncbi:unnamed protein product [Notodromas monacha]|uniref:Uncharacterized protein n=1 Tax=Notodromas monacha TaxID=399045 RepID=A0A7R9GFI9_9CRUS|nr:unnamed protein product [Notodromas monacha]CAG0918910.1 unnamed protein product [Notodromas monacha]